MNKLLSYALIAIFALASFGVITPGFANAASPEPAAQQHRQRGKHHSKKQWKKYRKHHKKSVERHHKNRGRHHGRNHG